MLDRPCPAAEAFQRADPDLWHQADARFEGRENEKGQWTDRRELPERWTVSHGPLRFELKRTDFGHLGLFPEQAENWEWIAEALSPLPLGEGQGCRVESCIGQSSNPSASSPSPPAPLPKGEGRRDQSPQPLRLHRREHAGGGRGGGGGGPRRRRGERRRLGTAKRRAFRAGRRAHPLDRRGRREVRQAGTETRQPLRRRDPRSAQLRPRAAGRGLAALETPAAAAGALRRVDGRAAGVHATDVPHARLRRGGVERDGERAVLRRSRRLDGSRPAFDPRGRRTGIAQRRRGAVET